jgi:anti-anti-sigma factor
METNQTQRGRVEILNICGHISSDEVHKLVKMLGALKATESKKVVLDLAVLKNLPTAVIGALIDLIRGLEQDAGRLIMAAPNPNVRVIFDRLGMSPMVTLTESVDEAVEMLQADEKEDPASSDSIPGLS